MSLSDIIRAMPKVELHVHLQGATQPETWLKLARRNHVDLPAKTLDEMRDWFRFTDFRHFIDTYIQVNQALVTADDLELMAREFLKNQAAQNIVYSELTYTPSLRTITGEVPPFEDQLAALNRARAWAESEFGVTMGIVIDIPREVTAAEADHYADWTISGYGRGVVAFGIAVIAIAALWFFLQRTRTGRAIRAVSQDETGAEIVGINLNQVYSLTFSLATAMAAIAGGCLLFMFQAYPTVGLKPLYFAWYVVMLVGLGNVAGAVIGGFIVALLQTATQEFVGIAWEDVVPTIIMILVLLVAPSGIFGSEVKGVQEQ